MLNAFSVSKAGLLRISRVKATRQTARLALGDGEQRLEHRPARDTSRREGATGHPRLILHTLLYMPAQIIGPLVQFAAILVFTHWLAPGPYGVLTYVMASQDFVFVLCL